MAWPSACSGGHVAWRAHDLAGQGPSRVGVEQLGQAEVADLGHAVGGEEDIARLEIAVDDTRLVGHVNGAGQNLDQAGGVAGAIGFSASALGEAAATDELEEEVRPFFLLADGIDRDDVRVTEPRDGLGLGAEPIAVLGIGVTALEHHLDRHETAELRVAGLVDDAHAAASQDREHLVIADTIRRRDFGLDRRIPVIGELEGRRDRGVHAELDHDRPGQIGEPTDELVGIGVLAALPPEDVFLVDEIQDRLRVVARARAREKADPRPARARRVPSAISDRRGPCPRGHGTSHRAGSSSRRSWVLPPWKDSGLRAVSASHPLPDPRDGPAQLDACPVGRASEVLRDVRPWRVIETQGEDFQLVLGELFLDGFDQVLVDDFLVGARGGVEPVLSLEVVDQLAELHARSAGLCRHVEADHHPEESLQVGGLLESIPIVPQSFEEAPEDRLADVRRADLPAAAARNRLAGASGCGRAAG